AAKASSSISWARSAPRSAKSAIGTPLHRLLCSRYNRQNATDKVIGVMLQHSYLVRLPNPISHPRMHRLDKLTFCTTLGRQRLQRLAGGVHGRGHERDVARRPYEGSDQTRVVGNRENVLDPFRTDWPVIVRVQRLAQRVA